MKPKGEKTKTKTDVLRIGAKTLHAKPQEGVDAIKGQYKRHTKDIPGVVDSKAKK